jgi:hypothetical protein
MESLFNFKSLGAIIVVLIACLIYYVHAQSLCKYADDSTMMHIICCWPCINILCSRLFQKTLRQEVQVGHGNVEKPAVNRDQNPNRKAKTLEKDIF